MCLMYPRKKDKSFPFTNFLFSFNPILLLELCPHRRYAAQVFENYDDFFQMSENDPLCGFQQYHAGAG